MTTCLITGTNRGIGLCLAKEALSRGWKVLGTARAPVTEPDAHICEDANFTDLVMDVTDHEAVKAVAASIDEPIDVLINNAGIIGPANDQQTTLNMDFDGFAETLAVNTLAPLAVSQAFLPNLRKSSNARILTISSQMSSMGYAKSDRIAYRASKVAVNKVMQGLATDLKPQNISVGLINPGWVRTDMGGDEADLNPNDVADGILDIAETLTIKETGHMFLWSGERQTFWEQ